MTSQSVNLSNCDREPMHVQETDVGLAIVKRIMDKHKGRIWVESVLDQGSNCYLQFPKPSGATGHFGSSE